MFTKHSYTYSSYSFNPCFNKFYQFICIFKIIIIAEDSVSVVYNAVIFISFKTFNKAVNAVPSCEFRKARRFYFAEHTFFAVGVITFITPRQILFHRAFSVFAPRQAAAGNSQFFFHIISAAPALCQFRPVSER